jgi:hypothetical protein
VLTRVLARYLVLTPTFRLPHDSTYLPDSATYVQNISTLYRLCITFLGRQTPSDFITQCFCHANTTPRSDPTHQGVDLHVNSQHINAMFTPHSESVQTLHRMRPAALGPVRAGPAPPPEFSHPRLRSPHLPCPLQRLPGPLQHHRGVFPVETRPGVTQGPASMRCRRVSSLRSYPVPTFPRTFRCRWPPAYTSS